MRWPLWSTEYIDPLTHLFFPLSFCRRSFVILMCSFLPILTKNHFLLTLWNNLEIAAIVNGVYSLCHAPLPSLNVFFPSSLRDERARLWHDLLCISHHVPLLTISGLLVFYAHQCTIHYVIHSIPLNRPKMNVCHLRLMGCIELLN